jgi:hypothetical protein
MEITLTLTAVEADFIACQLRHRMQSLERELVHTDARALQHALAIDLDVLEAIVLRLQAIAAAAA